MTTETTPQAPPRRTESGMQTRAVNAAAGVLLAAMQQGRQTPTGLAIALDSAQLLNSPEHAARVAELEARLAEYERPADEDPIRYTLTERAEATEVHPSTTSWQLEVLESGCWLGTGVRATSREAAEDLLREHRETKPDLEWRMVSTTTTYTLLAEDPCHPCGCPKRFDRHAWGCPTLADDVTPQVLKLRGLLAGQRAAVEDPHDSPLHHDYRVGRDLPEVQL